MSELENRGYSEPVHLAGKAFDSYQELEQAQQGLAKEFRTLGKTRLRTSKPEELENLKQRMNWLSEQIADLEEKKKQAAAAVGSHMDQHEKGQNLMDQADAKRVN